VLSAQDAATTFHRMASVLRRVTGAKCAMGSFESTSSTKRSKPHACRMLSYSGEHAGSLKGRWNEGRELALAQKAYHVSEAANGS